MKEVKINKKFEKILEDIKSIKIQGAENVAKAGMKAYLLEPTKSSAKKIISTRSTEPLLQNFIKVLLKSKNPKKTYKNLLKELKKSHEIIVKQGAKLIKNNMNVYSHCHSSTVIDILIYAKKKQKKDFVVYTSEVEPLLQGRQTAKDLAKAKIKTIVSPDLAAEQSLKNCDIFLFGADAFNKKVVANKIGTSTLCKLSKHYNIPTYSCAVSMKFTNLLKMELRASYEVWKDNNKFIDIFNPAFDKTPYSDLTGIISEFGVLSPKEFVKKAKQNLK